MRTETNRSVTKGIGILARRGRGRGMAPAILALCLLVTRIVIAAAAQEPDLAPNAPDVERQAAFDTFLAGVREEALAKGISQATLDASLTDLTPEPVVVSRDRAQPEQTQSLDAYVARRLSARTLRLANSVRATHRDVLARVEAATGVPPATMVAIWGLESNFGQFTGTYSTIRALATLAFDGRRPLFRTELFNALTIVERGQVTAAELKGSWAGAIGQPQFMPSSFLEHAVDFDEDGRIDIWKSPADVLGSMGQYLRSAGWQAGERWGREVRVSRAVLTRIDRDVSMRTGGCRAVREMTVANPLSTWARLGVRLADGRPLPRASLSASLVRGQRRYFLVYRNYDALVDYNCSNAYAITVGLLSDRIR